MHSLILLGFVSANLLAAGPSHVRTATIRPTSQENPPAAVDQSLLEQHLNKLKSTDYPTREAAQANIIAMGPGVLWAPTARSVSGDADFKKRWGAIVAVLGEPYRNSPDQIGECVMRAIRSSEQFRALNRIFNFGPPKEIDWASPEMKKLNSDFLAAFHGSAVKINSLKPDQAPADVFSAQERRELERTSEQMTKTIAAAIPGMEYEKTLHDWSVEGRPPKLGAFLRYHKRRYHSYFEPPSLNGVVSPIFSDAEHISIRHCAKPAPPLPGFLSAPLVSPVLKLRKVAGHSAIHKQAGISSTGIQFGLELEGVDGKNISLPVTRSDSQELGLLLFGKDRPKELLEVPYTNTTAVIP